MSDSASVKERARLAAFLTANRPGSRVEVEHVERIGGGFSRVMSRVRALVDGQPEWLVTRADPPAGQAAVDTDRDTEWAICSWLTDQEQKLAPDALHYDADGSALGTKTMVLEMVHGQPLLARAQTADTAGRAALANQLCDLAARIHSTDLTTFPAQLHRPVSWDEYQDGRLDQWREFAEVEQDPFAFHVVTWLRRNRPHPVPLTLVHGDFQAANVMVDDDGDLVAIDWEFSRIGDPREDLAWAAWIEAIQPPPLVGIDLASFCRRYAERTGLRADLVDPAALGYFMVLTGIQICDLAFPALRAFQSGQNRSIVTAYTFGMVATLHQAWMAGTGLVDP